MKQELATITVDDTKSVTYQSEPSPMRKLQLRLDGTFDCFRGKRTQKLDERALRMTPHVGTFRRAQPKDLSKRDQHRAYAISRKLPLSGKPITYSL